MERDARLVARDAQRVKSAAVGKVSAQSESAPNPVARDGWIVHAPERTRDRGELTGGPACLKAMRNTRYTAAEPSCPVCKVRTS
jgi:hypothetical protein